MPNVAVLIDAENVLPVFADQIFECAAAHGSVCAREIYGAAPALTTWVEPVLKYAMHSNLTIKASKWKNSSDIALVIGAMDLLAEGKADTVVLVSSDSDFSALSVRLRLAGMNVVGMGTEKSNELWQTACSEFVVLQPPAAPAAKTQAARGTQRTVKPAASAPAALPKPAPAAALPARSEPVRAQAAAPAQKAETPKPAEPARKAASTHGERTEVIRNYIQRQLDENHGKMALSVLFQNLRTLPEYRVDQRGSKRKPLSYLMWLFGDLFTFEDAGSGGTWISMKGQAAEAAGGNEPAAETGTSEEGKKEQAEEASEAVEAAAVGNNAAEEENEAGPTQEDSEAPEVAAAAAGEKAPETEDVKPQTTGRSGKTAASWSGALMASIAEAQRTKPAVPSGAEEKAEKAEKTEEPQAEAEKKEPISLYDIGLQPRPLKSLISQGYTTLDEVAKLSDQELIAMKNIGVLTVDVIRAAAKKAGL